MHELICTLSDTWGIKGCSVVCMCVYFAFCWFHTKQTNILICGAATLRWCYYLYMAATEAGQIETPVKQKKIWVSPLIEQMSASCMLVFILRVMMCNKPQVNWWLLWKRSLMERSLMVKVTQCSMTLKAIWNKNVLFECTSSQSLSFPFPLVFFCDITLWIHF